MHPLFQNIKSVGFDIDNTLYPPSPEIDLRIKKEVAKRILEKKPDLQTLDNALKFSEERYSELGSRAQVMRSINIPEPGKVMDDCLTKADILDLLSPNEEIISLVKEISKKYQTFLITGNPTLLALPKLERIGIPQSLFHHALYSDSENITKTSGLIYKQFLSQSSFPPEQHVYIGDNLKADILPTKALGMKSILVTWSNDRKEQEADASVEKIQDIKSLLL
jgi:FMN phosphatase YigB (HAD superfamily)